MAATSDDPHDLARFVTAQDRVWPNVLAELGRGAKATHWMWFVFPQHIALGRSETARQYGIASADEARAYLRHPVLGSRLGACTSLVLAVHGKTVRDIFGVPDDLKFCSSMTLFEHVARDQPLFAQAIERCCGGRRDPRTLALL